MLAHAHVIRATPVCRDNNTPLDAAKLKNLHEAPKGQAPPYVDLETDLDR